MSQMPPPPYGTRSPDGRWWWDGQAWQPVPPAQQAPATYAPQPQYAYPTPHVAGPTGPLGQPRSIGVSILLAIVTIGIYTFVWVYKTHNEVKRHSGIGVGGVVGVVIYILIAPVTFFIIPSEVRQMYEASGQQSPVRGIHGLWFLLPLIGHVIWFIQVQGALNRYWASRGGGPTPAYALPPAPAQLPPAQPPQQPPS